MWVCLCPAHLEGASPVNDRGSVMKSLLSCKNIFSLLLKYVSVKMCLSPLAMQCLGSEKALYSIYFK